jgi:uncharacterized protein YndB with AHSA1/START domain
MLAVFSCFVVRGMAYNFTRMGESKFQYVICIRSTQDRVWDGLTQSELTRRYWCEVAMESDWKKGSPWRMLAPGGKVADAGDVREIERPKKLVLSWQHQLMPELKAEGVTTATFDLQQMGDTVKLTVTHSIDHENSKLIADFANGWPPLLSSLKSLLETGEPLAMTTKWPEGM